MKSAKEFATWLNERFKDTPAGIYLSREDITTLSYRQHFSQAFVADVHYELTLKGMGFVAGAHRDKFYLFQLPTVYWQQDEPYQDHALHKVHTLSRRQA